MAITFGAWAGKLLALRRQVSFEATPKLYSLNLLEGGKAPRPSGRTVLLNAGTFHISRQWMAAGELSARVRRNPPGRVKEGA